MTRIYWDMLLAARKVAQYTQGVVWERFRGDDLLQNAVMRMIQIVGEAASKISPEYRKAHPEIPWRGIIGMRHRLVHEYFRIDPERVWKVVENDLPALIAVVEPLVPPDEPANME